MAQKTQITLEDDVDGGEASETILFGLDGVSYEIDLSDENAATMRDSLASWVGHARRVRGRKKSGMPAAKAKRTDLDKVRVWARENGYQVSNRGRIAADITAAYDAGH